MAQHGASVAEDFPDADAEMIRRVRAAVGPRVPIGVVVDTHGNISPAQLAPATVTLAWQTNPHVDCREQGLALRRADRPDDPRRDRPGPGDREATARAQHPAPGHRRATR